MSDKLARAQHTRVPDPAMEPVEQTPSEARSLRTPSHARAADPSTTSEIRIGGRHAGLDRTAIAAAVAQQVVPRPKPHRQSASTRAAGGGADPGSTSQITIVGNHTGTDRTRPDQATAKDRPSSPMAARQNLATKPGTGSTGAVFVDGHHAGADRTVRHVKQSAVMPVSASENTAVAVGSSAALISLCTIISRVTGFIRTWAMAFALGVSALSSSYQVANTLPNQLYELVAGGVIVTAFLPVYISAKKKLGRQASNEYASNLFTLVILFLGVLSVLCMAFPSVAIYTQSFLSNQADMGTATYLFQFFAIQIVFYGASVILQGLLNAHRNYLWSSIAPVANNVIVIATFILYAFVAPANPSTALLIIAVGNPLGVLVQVLIQLPALKRSGIRLRLRVNFRDPTLRETLSIGIPAVFVMAVSFVVVSVQTAASLVFNDAGPSMMAYARLWFTLPYSFLAVPITTAMFTELSEMQAEGDTEGVKRGIVSGTNQILFFMIPFALFLVVFSLPLVMLYHAGAFSLDGVGAIAAYLTVLACGLPFYGVNTYLQKIFSSLRKMGAFAVFNLIAAIAQIGLTIGGALLAGRGMPLGAIAAAEVAFYVVADACLFAYLRHHLGPFGLRSVAKAIVSGIVLGGLGAVAGGGILFALQTFLAPLSGSIPQALAYVAVGGIASLVVTFGLSLKLHVPEAAFVSSIIGKVKGKRRRT